MRPSFFRARFVVVVERALNFFEKRGHGARVQIDYVRNEKQTAERLLSCECRGAPEI